MMSHNIQFHWNDAEKENDWVRLVMHFVYALEIPKKKKKEKW